MLQPPTRGAPWDRPSDHRHPLDDRDAGVVALGGQGLLVSHFRHPLTYLTDYELAYPEGAPPDRRLSGAMAGPGAGVGRLLRSRSAATGGVTFSDEVQVPSAPAALPDGRLLYLGKGIYHPGGRGHPGL